MNNQSLLGRFYYKAPQKYKYCKANGNYWPINSFPVLIPGFKNRFSIGLINGRPKDDPGKLRYLLDA